MKKIANIKIKNDFHEWEEGTAAREFVEVPRKYGAKKTIFLDPESGDVLSGPDAEKRGRKQVVVDAIQANTFHAVRHLACTAMNAATQESQNNIEDSKQSRSLLKQLKGVNKGDENAAFLWIEDSTHAWLVRTLNARGVHIFGGNAAGVLEVVETVLKDDETK
jgi:hypothetical protein